MAPAGTFTFSSAGLTMPERTSLPSLPCTPLTFRLRVRSLLPVLVKGTCTVVRSEASCGQLKLPAWTAGAESTFWFTAPNTSRTPPPVWSAPATLPPVRAEETRAALICCAVQSGWAWRTTAAAPATCGVAMEVPDIVR